MNQSIRSDVKQYIPIVEELNKDFNKGRYKLIEIGANAHLIKDLMPKNITYHSLDLEGDNTYNFDLDNERLPIKNNTYDIIVCTETLEHTLYPHRIMKEMVRIAKKQATFFLSQPNEYNFVQRIYYLIGKKSMITDEPYMIVEKHQHIHKPRVNDIFALFSVYIKIEKHWFIWNSRYSGHGKRFRIIIKAIDGIISTMANVMPSLFTRLVLVKGVKYETK